MAKKILKTQSLVGKADNGRELKTQSLVGKADNGPEVGRKLSLGAFHESGDPDGTARIQMFDRGVDADGISTGTTRAGAQGSKALPVKDARRIINAQEAMPKYEMKKGGVVKTKKAYAKGGAVRGAGCATKGVRKARMY